MTELLAIGSDGPRGPVYLTFSKENIATTEPAEDDDELVVDYDASGGIVGVEVVAVTPERIVRLVALAATHGLDLGALFTRSTLTPAA